MAKKNTFRSKAEKKVDEIYGKKPKDTGAHMEKDVRSIIKNRTRDLDEKYGL